MKKVLKVALIVLCISVLLIAVFFVWQRDNFEVILNTISYSQDQIDTLVEESKNRTEEILKKFTESGLMILGDEDIKKLINGEITEEEALEIINKKRVDLKYEDETKYSGAVDEIVSKMYALRAEYSGAIASLESEAFGAAKSIPKEQRTFSKKLELLETYTGRAVALESQCDAKMEGLIKELETALDKSGGDKSLISEIRSAYASEKSAKKSQLLGKYGKYLK